MPASDPPAAAAAPAWTARRPRLYGRPHETKPEPALADREPQNHRTVDRVTRILEEVVYNPGMTFAELARALDAPKSSVYGFIQGLLAKGWLYETNRRFYLGPAVYGLTLASGQIRAGSVNHADLEELCSRAKVAAFLGIQAGDHLIYVAEAGADPVTGFDARTNIRRSMLATAGGKALLAARSDAERESHLRRRRAEEPELVAKFLDEYAEIKRTGIATNLRQGGARFAIATIVRNQAGQPVASVTLVGTAKDMQPRAKRLTDLLLKQVDAWSKRATAAREPI